MALVSRDEQRERVTLMLAARLLETGLAETSMRQLAAATGVSDRMLLYYFKDKADLLLTVLGHIAADMGAILAAAIPEDADLAPMELISRAAAVTQSAAMRPYMQLWIEIVAAASRGEQPYAAISTEIAGGFVQWIETRLAGGPSDAKTALAALVFALVDGLALLDICMGEAQSQRAMTAMAKLSFPGLE